MAYKLFISQRAEEHIDNIVSYVAVTLQNPGAARAIIADIGRTYERLERMADSYAMCQDPYLAYKGYRKIALAKHDYVILYTVIDDRVYVSGVFHMLENYIDKL